MSKRKLAQKAGIPYSTLISAFNRHSKNFSFLNMRKVADVLGVSVEYLAGLEDISGRSFEELLRRGEYIEAEKLLGLPTGTFDADSAAKTLREFAIIDDFMDENKLKQGEEVLVIVNIEREMMERLEYIIDMLKNATPEQVDKISKMIELMLDDTKN